MSRKTRTGVEIAPDVAALPISKAAKRIVHDFVESEAQVGHTVSPQQARKIRRKLMWHISHCTDQAVNQGGAFRNTTLADVLQFTAEALLAERRRELSEKLRVLTSLIESVCREK